MDARKRKEHQWATQEGYAACSWWLDVERFYQNAQAEQSRMKRSRFGRTELLTMGRNVPLTAKPPSILAAEEDE